MLNYCTTILENNALSKECKLARKIILTLIKKHKFLTMYCYYNNIKKRDLKPFFKQHFYFKIPIRHSFYSSILFQNHSI